MKVICLGFDGASPGLVEKWKDSLPNFLRFFSEGVWGRLKSVIPPVSPQAWTSFATGKNPGKHGIFGFKRRKPGSYELEFINGSWVRAKPLWRYLSEKGRRVVVVNIPVTYPPIAVNGVLISGMDTPGRGASYTYPPELKAEIESLFPDYVISMHFGGYLTDEERVSRALEELLHEAEVRTRVLLHLLERDFDFAVVKYNLTDLAHHYFWKYMDETHPAYEAEYGEKFSDAILRVYRKADECIGRLVERFPDATIIVLSDHGGGPAFNKSINLNEWLRREGLLVVKKGGGGSRTVKLIEGLLLWLMRNLSHGAKDTLRRVFPGLRSKVVSALKFANIDWSGTKAFAGETLGGIRINLKGEFPQGTVERGEYEELRERIIGGLRGLVDPKTGERCFDGVWRREELYEGPCTKEAADIVALPRECGYFLSSKVTKDGKEGIVQSRPHWRGVCGAHRLEGIFGAMGENIRQGLEVEGVRLVDLAPTILYMLGLPVPRDYDGKVLGSIFKDFSKEPDYVDDGEWGAEGGGIYTKEEEEQVLETLRGLGYIE